MKKKVLITGANGFLGGRVLEDLLQRGYNVTATARQEHIEHALTGFRYIRADLRDSSCIDMLGDNYDCVIHCAAKSSPWGDYRSFYEANIRASENILLMSRKYGVGSIVYISTPSVYFTFGDRLNIREDAPLPDPMVNHYATTKYLAEQMMLQSEIPVIALRPRALIGRGDTVIMPRVLHAYHQGKLRIIGSGDNIVDLTPVANVVRAVHDAMNAPAPAWNQAYNIGCGQPVKLWDTIKDLFGKLGLKFENKRVPYFAAYYFAFASELVARYLTGKEPALTRYGVAILRFSMTMDISKAARSLGYTPVQTVAQGMDEFVEWWKICSDDY